MDNCPIFLTCFRRKEGLTLTEVLIVVAFLGILGVLLLVALKPGTQMEKARDARRKADLSKLRNILEDYYNDYNRYPESLACKQSLLPYLDEIPCDPETGGSYTYLRTSSSYRLYTKLENKNDPKIKALGCLYGCGPSCAYNYGISSSNVRLQSCTEGGECGTDWYACQAGFCNNYGPPKPTCPLGGPSFCGLPCGRGCLNEGGPEANCS